VVVVGAGVTVGAGVVVSVVGISIQQTSAVHPFMSQTPAAGFASWPRGHLKPLHVGTGA
jgi:hypothetical protein